MNTWRAFWHLSSFERKIVLESATALTATRVGLRLLGFRRWKSFLGLLATVKVSESLAVNLEVLAAARHVAQAQERTVRHLFFEPNCLERSLVLWWLLRIRSTPSVVRIGGRKAADRFEAHAWVECGGVVLSGAGESHLHFVPFDGPIPNWESPVN